MRHISCWRSSMGGNSSQGTSGSSKRSPEPFGLSGGSRT